MFPLDKEDLQTMDIRIPNISPKEAEQMDPQHRLAILLAYEALQKGGYANTTQSFDNRRVAYYAAVASDDYRENASSAPAGISSYFISGKYAGICCLSRQHADRTPSSSGCIRAFVAGALSFALKLEGPANTVDSGEASGLVMLEHAQHALLAKQCDVALAGAFHVNTQPALFVGWDVDGYLTHAGEDRTFAADKDGIVRGDGAIVFLLKRLSDAVAEGDTILATLPPITHRTLSSGFGIKEMQDGIQRGVAHAGLQVSDIVHVETAGCFDARSEAAEFTAISKALQKKSQDAASVTVGCVQSNFGASEAAINAVSVMKAVLLLQHGKIPAQRSVSALNPVIETIVERGGISIPWTEQEMPRPDNSRRTVAIHGLALAGIQAVGFVREAPVQVESVPKLDHSPHKHVLSLSAKTTDAIEAMRADLIAYLQAVKPDLQRLSYTLLCRRIAHQHRITVCIGTTAQAVEELGIAPVVTVGDQSALGKAAMTFQGRLADTAVADLLKIVSVAKLCDIANAPLLSRAQELPTEDIADLSATQVEVAVATMLHEWGVVFSKVIAVDRGLLAALVIARLLTPVEATMLSLSGRSSKAVRSFLQRIKHRRLAVELVFGGNTLPLGTHLEDFLEDAHLGLVEGVPAGRNDIARSGDTLLALCLSSRPLDDIQRFCAEVHSRGGPISWTMAFLPALSTGDLKPLSDAPTYAFSLTKHWIDYRHRSLRRHSELSSDGTEEDTKSSAGGAFSSPSCFPMLGELVDVCINMVDRRVIFETALTSAPMIHFIMGHLVNDVAIAPATLYADLFLSAASDVYGRAQMEGGSADAGLLPELLDMEMVKALIVEDKDTDSRVLVISVAGNFHEGKFHVELSSRDANGTISKHATAQVIMSDPTRGWAKLQKFVATRYSTVRTSPAANKISSKLAYSAFETVVSYTAHSGFRGIQSVAMLEDDHEAATTVRLSMDAPKGVFTVNPCLIDSLGQITGLICNATADSDVVYIAESVKAMRFTEELSRLANSGALLRAYCAMDPQDDGATVFEGDAFFLDEDLRIIGEMEGVKYKRIPRTLLDVLLPHRNKKTAAKPAKFHQQKSEAIRSSHVVQKQDISARILGTILETVAIELGVQTAELVRDRSFADLGVDSLMQLVILGALTELPIEVSRHPFPAAPVDRH